ncbi:DUF3460 family protein [Oxalobacteraceae bacterium A2-2]
MKLLFKQHRKYESEHTLFIKALKEKDPGIDQRQQEGRALLWDRPSTSLADQQRLRESAVKQQAYVYQNKL